jgi:hypothetical protein
VGGEHLLHALFDPRQRAGGAVVNGASAAVRRASSFIPSGF